MCLSVEKAVVNRDNESYHYPQRTFKEYSGNIQGTFREHPVNIQPTFSRRSLPGMRRSMFIHAAHICAFSEHSRNIEGAFNEHSGNIQGTFREH
jgi:hypothetical protein